MHPAESVEAIDHARRRFLRATVGLGAAWAVLLRLPPDAPDADDADPPVPRQDLEGGERRAPPEGSRRDVA